MSNEPKDVREWLQGHSSDYANVRHRLDICRNVMLNGRIDSAIDMLKKSYTFAVMSIRTNKDRHEDAFISHYKGRQHRKDAFLQTVYGGQKYGWDRKTHKNVDWEALVLSIRHHVKNNQYGKLLDIVVEKMTGVSHRKGSFMMAMIGLYEYMCIDSNVGRFADIDVKRSYNSGNEYLEDCYQIARSVDTQNRPFVIQWAIYDIERGEHSRHMAFYREVLNL